MQRQPTWKNFFVLSLVASISTALFVFFGTPMLRVLRGVFGAKKFWLAGILISSLPVLLKPELLFFALFFFSLWFNVGIYQEFEERGRSGFWIAVLSVGLSSALMIFGPILWMSQVGLEAAEVLRTSFDNVAQQVLPGKQMSDIGVSSEMIVSQLPSMLIVLQIASLAFALMLDRRAAGFFGFRYNKVASQMRLMEFRVPDQLIWIAMLSFLFSFLKIENQLVTTVALNIFNVMMGLYFFQGLAVLEVSFLAFRAGSFFKLLFYLLVVGQLFFLLSLVGVIDYWVDFRLRLRRWRLSGKDQKNGENV